MADLDANDLSRGPEVRWYAGGVLAQETTTGTLAKAGYTLAHTADYGLAIVTADGVQIDYTSTASTELLGMDIITVAAGVADAAVIDIYYVDTETTGLTHIASAEDFKSSSKADTEKKAVHGQKNKINIIGTTEHSGSFSQLMVTKELKAMFVGAKTAGPKSGESTWSNKVSAFHKIGCLVGKKYDESTGAITKKWALMGVSFNSHDQDFPTTGVYADSFNVDIDWLMEWG